MKIPKYIKEHIETNNKLLEQADKHALIVKNWYENQLKKLNVDDTEIADEEFAYIQNNWFDNGIIDVMSIENNLNMLENEYLKSGF